MPLQIAASIKISRVSAPAGSSSASVGGVLGSGLLKERGQGQISIVGKRVSSQVLLHSLLGLPVLFWLVPSATSFTKYTL